MLQVNFEVNARLGFGYSREVSYIAKVITENIMELGLEPAQDILQAIGLCSSAVARFAAAWETGVPIFHKPNTDKFTPPASNSWTREFGSTSSPCHTKKFSPKIPS
ncbi:hypothetical protein LQV05_004118 [Cryptococcus neoformans]|nr:hypothetical protein J007_06803 [Cryptococcus neoformans var. grubii]OXC57671.1 hypothetical protein C358_06897 [Cryptococcus neoformans var. grubii MW-RSA852]UOH81448.1 hypothetical protein LQV05_004118 [Cryptococcus neoformans]